MVGFVLFAVWIARQWRVVYIFVSQLEGENERNEFQEVRLDTIQ